MKLPLALRRAGRALAVGVVAAGLLGACADDGPPKVAANVGGVEIRSSDTEALIDAYLARQKAPDQKDLPRNKIAKIVLGYQIKLAFLESLAKQHGVVIPPDAEFDTAVGAVGPDAYRAVGMRQEDFAASLKAGRLSKALAEKLFPNTTVSDNAVKAEYDRRAPEFARSWKATVQLAQFGDEEPAANVKEQTQSGVAFPEAATALGAARVDMVDVNPVVASLPGNVLDAIGALDPGEVSGAIPAGEIFIAARLERRQDTDKLTFDEVKGELTADLVEQEQARLFQEWFEKQFRAAKVGVAGHYGEWSDTATAVL